MKEEFSKNVDHRAIVSFGSKDDCAERKVVSVESRYMVLGEPPHVVYIPYRVGKITLVPAFDLKHRRVGIIFGTDSE
jgi:hypothetical protein